MDYTFAIKCTQHQKRGKLKQRTQSMAKHYQSIFLCDVAALRAVTVALFSEWWPCRLDGLPEGGANPEK